MTQAGRSNVVVFFHLKSIVNGSSLYNLTWKGSILEQSDKDFGQEMTRNYLLLCKFDSLKLELYSQNYQNVFLSAKWFPIRWRNKMPDLIYGVAILISVLLLSRSRALVSKLFFPSLIAFPFSPTGPVDLNMMSKCAPCLANPCQNNGTCVSDVTGSYHCTCPFGYKVKDRFVLTRCKYLCGLSLLGRTPLP